MAKIKFRSKPRIIEGEQFKGKDGPVIEGVCYCEQQLAHLHTTHKNQIVILEPGDWVIPESNGNGYYPIKDEIINKYYERLQ